MGKVIKFPRKIKGYHKELKELNERFGFPEGTTIEEVLKAIDMNLENIENMSLKTWKKCIEALSKGR